MYLWVDIIKRRIIVLGKTILIRVGKCLDLSSSSESTESFSLRWSLVEHANCSSICVELLPNGANLLLHNVVGLLLVAEHKLHQVQFALHQALGRDSRVNVSHVLGSGPSFRC